MARFSLLIGCAKHLQLQSACRASLAVSRYGLNAIQYTQHRFAGHSHWANIRHIKGAKDAIKSAVSQQVAAKLRVALRETGGANPKHNRQLAKVIEFAEGHNIPSKSIQAMITKAESSKLDQTTIEVKGPSGSMLIFEISTPNYRKTRNEVTRIVSKRCGGSLMTEGGTRNHFERKGVIVAKPRGAEPLSLEQATDIAILVNAEDVDTCETETGDSGFQITCEPDLMYDVVKGLDDTDLDVLDYNVRPIPLNTVELSENDRMLLDNAMQAIKCLKDIDLENVYDNIKWPEQS